MSETRRERDEEVKALVFLAARNDRASALVDRLPAVAEALLSSLGASARSATAMAALDEDPLRFSTAGVRAFEASLDLRAAGANADSRMLTALRGLGAQLRNLIFSDLSAALVGENKAFLDHAPTPLRFQYLMRRRHDLSQAEYLEHYEQVHSRFGLETGGIEGYHQFHVDPARTRNACDAAGFGTWEIASVSELHIPSMDDFLTAVGASDLGVRAAEDEERFVDRPNSVMFTSKEIWRRGR